MDTSTLAKHLQSLPAQGRVLFNEPLAAFTSWRIGGPAEILFLPKNVEDLSLFLENLPADVPLTWLGLGSNTLVRDGGVPGVVIVTQGGLNQLTLANSLLYAEAGVSCAQLARYAARQSYVDLEFMAGIPGTVGGALAMNAGCFNGETWQYVVKVKTIDRHGKFNVRTKAEFEIAYRKVIKPSEEWFVAGYFEAIPGDKELSLTKIRDLLARRNQTQPTGTANCGSVFKNPPDNYAAKLIETCGLKGKREGGASVSLKHANFIINDQNAKAVDVEKLIQEISTIVFEQTGVRLMPEVCIIGRS